MIFKPILRTVTKGLKGLLLLLLISGAHSIAIAQPPGPPAGTKTFTVTVMLEGLFNTATSQMNKAQDVGPANRFPGTIADRITIELHPASGYGTPSYTTTVNLLQDGTAIAYLPQSGSYYLTIKHRNHLETVSAASINLASANNYNFTSAASQAFGSNQVELATGVFGVYGGDVNQDDILSGADLVGATADVRGGITGYVITDVNGDGVLSGADLVRIAANVRAGIEILNP